MKNKVKPDFNFELTQQQMEKINLDKIIEQLEKADVYGKRKMIICSMSVSSLFGENEAFVEGLILDNETAAKVIKIINPEKYEWNIKHGLINEVK
jgi:hypothetical protein